jgi:hypothetical protein
MRFLTLLVGLLAINFNALAQISSNGTGGGPWSSTATWAGGKIPVGGNNSLITIKSGDVVYVPSGYSVSIDQTLIEDGATLNVDAGGTLTIANGTGDDLTIVNNGGSTGKLNVSGTLVLSQTATTAESGTTPSAHLTAATTAILNGGLYRHNYSFTGGTVIGADWQDGSTIQILSITAPSSAPSNLDQSFYNFVWDCPGQRSHLSLAGQLTTVRNNLSIGSTGGVQLKLFGTSSNNTLNVGGDFSIYSNPILYFSDGGTNNTVNVAGDMIITSASTNIFFAFAGSTVFNIQGAFQHSNVSGRIFFGNAAGAIVTMNMYGDVVLNGQLRTNNGSYGVLNFRGTTNYSGGTNLLGIFNFAVYSGATLDLGTNYLKNTSGSFTLQSGGTLKVGATDAAGAIQANTTLGNIRTPLATRSYASGSTIYYNGTGAQQLGTSHPINSGINLVIDNPVSVGLAGAVTTRSLVISQGTLNSNNFNVTTNGDFTINGAFVPGSNTVFFNGTGAIGGSGTMAFNNITVNASGVVSFPSSDLNISGNFTTLSGGVITPSSSNVIFNGSGSQTITSSGNSLGNVVVNKNAGTVTLADALSVSSISFLQGTLSSNNFNITDSGNWTIASAATFLPGTGTVTFVGTGAISGAGTKSFNNLTITSGTVTFPSDDLFLTGNLVRSGGAINSNSGTVTFSGVNSQTINVAGSQLRNITVNKTGGDVTLSSALSFSGVLNVQSATAFNSAGFLTLLSTSTTADASIGPLLNGASVQGPINVQRYMAARGNTNRYISPPVSGATVAMLQDDFFVTGSFTGTSYPCSGCSSNAASLKYYNPLTLNVSASSRFVAYPTTTNSAALEVGRGYAAYQWQNKVVNLDYTGTVNSGTVALPVYYAVSTPAIPSADNYNLVGNPFPSSIRWDGGSGWSNTNVGTTAYVPVGSVSKTYNYTDGSGDLTDGIISMGQAFYVVSNNSSPALSVNENAKTTLTGVGNERERNENINSKTRSEQFIVSIIAANEERSNGFLKLNKEATDDFDVTLDAYKLPAGLMSISFEDKHGQELVMHTVTSFEPEQDVVVHVEVLEAGAYRIGFRENDKFPMFYLFDKYTGEYTQAVYPNEYNFHVDAAGQINDRFVLTQTPNFEQVFTERIKMYPNPANDKVKISLDSEDAATVELADVRGQGYVQQTFVKETILDVSHLPAGVYLVKVKTATGFVIRKLMKN